MARALLRLVACIAVTAAAAFIGAQATRNAPDFYTSLQLPAWAPPPGVFGPVWSVLYLLRAVALWRIWTVGPSEGRGMPTAWYLLQLAFNAFWSWAFFAWHRGGVAFLVIVVLWGLIVVTIALFRRRDRWAAWLLAPYLAWVSFAAVLNVAVWRANPGALNG